MHPKGDGSWLAYDAIDADGHILEPLDLWDQRRTQKPRQTRSLAGL
jgi:hypothetical protein